MPANRAGTYVLPREYKRHAAYRIRDGKFPPAYPKFAVQAGCSSGGPRH
jgi:hypothetical protein